MPKSAIINTARPGMIEEVSFKKLALFFDRIYVEDVGLLFVGHNAKESNKLKKKKEQFLPKAYRIILFL